MNVYLLNKLFPYNAVSTLGTGQIRINETPFPANDFFMLDSLVSKLAGQYIREKKRMVCVEIGAWTGFSTCVLAYYAKQTGGKTFTIDTFMGSPGTNMDDPGYSDSVKYLLSENLKRVGVDDSVTIFQATSDACVHKFKDNSIDFMFIDGDHRYSQFKKDFENWYPKMVDGGIFTGHDFNGVEYKEEFIEDDYMGDKHHGISKMLADYPIRYQEDSSVWHLIKNGSLKDLKNKESYDFSPNKKESNHDSTRKEPSSEERVPEPVRGSELAGRKT